jgi:ADP-ribose pyrophosphatase YjhB (NUDIX family)
MVRSTRVAVRIVLLDPASRVLLFEGRDLSDESDSRRYWFTAGGGVEGSESLLEAADREIGEETGQLGLRLEGPIHRYEFDFLNHGLPQHQVEYFFAARTADLSVGTTGWTELEKQAMTRWCWWSVADLEAAGVRYFPEDLSDLVRKADHLV